MKDIKNLLVQDDVRLEIKEYGIIVKNPNLEDAKAITKKTEDFIKFNNNEIDIFIKDIDIIRFLFEKLVEGINMDNFSDEEVEVITTKPSALMKKITNKITEIIYDLAIDKINEFTLKFKELELKCKTNEIRKNIDSFSEKTGIKIPEFNLKSEVVDEPAESTEDKIIRLTEEMSNEKNTKKKRVIFSELTKLYEEIDKENE